MDHGPSCLYEASRNQNIINLSSLLNSVYPIKDVDIDCSFFAAILSSFLSPLPWSQVAGNLGVEQNPQHRKNPLRLTHSPSPSRLSWVDNGIQCLLPNEDCLQSYWATVRVIIVLVVAIKPGGKGRWSLTTPAIKAPFPVSFYPWFGPSCSPARTPFSRVWDSVYIFGM